MSAAAKFFLAFFRAYEDGVSPMVRLKGGQGTSGITENGVICKNEEGFAAGRRSVLYFGEPPTRIRRAVSP